MGLITCCLQKACLHIFAAKEPAMKSDYWDVTDEQVIEKTGKNKDAWIKILDAFGAASKKSNDVVAHLQQEYRVPRYWARTLTTLYQKQGQE